MKSSSDQAVRKGRCFLLWESFKNGDMWLSLARGIAGFAEKTGIKKAAETANVSRKFESAENASIAVTDAGSWLFNNWKVALVGVLVVVIMIK